MSNDLDADRHGVRVCARVNRGRALAPAGIVLGGEQSTPSLARKPGAQRLFASSKIWPPSPMAEH